MSKLISKPEIKYWPNGQKLEEDWKIEWLSHRVGGPAYQEWYESGQKRMEIWRINGKICRLDGPSYLVWYENGQKYIESWWIDYNRHRLDGPSHKEWNDAGTLIEELWDINDIPILNPESYKQWLIDNNLYEKYPWTDEELVLWRLTWNL